MPGLVPPVLRVVGLVTLNRVNTVQQPSRTGRNTKKKKVPRRNFWSAQAERKNDLLLTDAPGPISVSVVSFMFFICLLSWGVLEVFSSKIRFPLIVFFRILSNVGL